MVRTGIKNISETHDLSNEQMNDVTGGACEEGFVILKGLGCVPAKDLDRFYDKREIIVDKNYNMHYKKLNAHAVSSGQETKEDKLKSR